jgi:hypothetical protein
LPALRFVVLRTTNLTGAIGYNFELVDAGPYGFNGIQGAIDPFGWNAPAGWDPWGSTVFDAGTPAAPCGYGSPGAFSIDLWLLGQTPTLAPP